MVEAKRWLSPLLIGRLKSSLRRGNYFSGNYPDWAAAARHSAGYADPSILDSVRSAMRQVCSGKARYERDSVLFDEIHHSFPLLAGLLRAAAEDGNRLAVLDFGGALGSTYHQCREFLAPITDLTWAVVEQDRFVAAGREEFETSELKFFDTVAECVRQLRPNVAVLSGVLQYLENPYGLIAELCENGIRYVLVDRTIMSALPDDRIAVQHVPASVYKGSYPVRILSREKLRRSFAGTYESLAEFEVVWDGSHPEFCDGVEFHSRGMILRKVEGAKQP